LNSKFLGIGSRKGRLLLITALVLGVTLAFVGTALAGYAQETPVDDVAFVPYFDYVSYNVDLTEGDSVVVRAICLEEWIFPWIEVWSPSGALVASKGDNYTLYPCAYFGDGIDVFAAPLSGVDSLYYYSARAAFTAPEAGTYTINVWNWPSTLSTASVEPLEDGEEGGLIHTIVERTFWVEEAAEGVPCNIGDGRLNPHCGAPVAIYPGSYDIYAIDPATSEGDLVLHLSDEEIEAAGVPTTAPIVLDTVSNPFSGQPITVYRLTTGELQLNTYYADGKPYIVRWELGASGVEVVVW